MSDVGYGISVRLVLIGICAGALWQLSRKKVGISVSKDRVGVLEDRVASLEDRVASLEEYAQDAAPHNEEGGAE